MRARDLFLLTVAAIAALGARTSFEGSMLEWALFDSTCTDIASDATFDCASYGVFYFGGIDNQGTCEPLAEGEEPERHYPRPINPWEIPPGQQGFLSGPGESGGGLPDGFQQHGPQMPLPPIPWIAILDWNDSHGLSVDKLADTLSGPQVETRFYGLDDPDLGPLGDDVGDQHVLAQLCAVAVDAESAAPDEPLLAVNMSFGRLTEEDDAGDGPSCDDGSLSCQIARVLERLWLGGATPIAAAGNHKSLIFPASLAETVATGAIDVQAFVQRGETQPTWETPSTTDGLLPGQALCVDGSVVAAGSSYSAAFLSGWYALLALDGLVGDGVGRPWAPAWSPDEGCFVLGSAGELFGGCNPNLEEVLAGLARGPASGCWSEIGAGGAPILESALPADPQSQPPIPSLDAWVAENRPAPESDPCIPCVGDGAAVFGEGSGPDLVVNLSASQPIDARDGILDEVLLRIDDGFYPLGLSEADLAALQDATAGGLRLNGFLPLLPPDEQASLVYLFKTITNVSCRDQGPNSELCFWSSTPLLVMP